MKNKRFLSSRKAQLTMFVILGIVLLIIVSLLFAIRRGAEKDIHGIQDVMNELSSGTVSNHISACISAVAQDGIQKLGANGGRIYDFQGGSIALNDLAQDELLNYSEQRPGLEKNHLIAYGLKVNHECAAINYELPEYPLAGEPLSGLASVYKQECLYSSADAAYDGFFGQSTLSKLCYSAKASGCEGFAKGRAAGLTIQKQLEDYVAHNLESCVNLSAYASMMSAELAAESEPDVESVVRGDELELLVKYPVSIKFSGQKPVTELVDYQVMLDIRLEALYNFLYNILSMDAKKHGFELDKDFITSPYWKPGFSAKRISNPCADCDLPYSEDDLVEVSDADSEVNGQPLVLRAASANRRPALDFIQDVEIDVRHSSFVNIPLYGYDPDDAGISYYFLSLGLGRSGCSGRGAVVSSSGWCEQDVRVSGGAGLLDKLDKKTLRMPVNRFDSGEHKVRILAVDDSGLFDYQDFWINITDSSANKLPEQECLDNCSASPVNDCDEWCTISNNQCNSQCLGDFSSPEQDDECSRCVYPIAYSEQLQQHADCSAYAMQQCIQHMPDCFWIKKLSRDKQCINDWELDQAEEAYLVVE